MNEELSELHVTPGQVFGRACVIDRLNAYIAHKGTQKAAAQALGVSPQYLGDVLKGRREPGEKILTPLGIRRKIYFVDVSAKNP